MQYYIVEYELCALIFLAIIIIRYFSRKHFPNMPNRMFGYILILSAIDIILDIVSSYIIEQALVMPPFLVQAVNICFYAIQTALPPVVLVYVFMRAGHFDKQRMRYILPMLAPAALMILALLLNPLHGLFFYVDPVAGYIHGSLFTSLYGLCALYLIGVLILINVLRKLLTKAQYTTIWIFVLIVMASVVIQMFFPRHLITGVAIAVSATLMNFTMQDPNDMVDVMTDAFHYGALLSFLSDMINENKDFQIISLDIPEMRRINGMMGMQAGYTALRDVAAFLTSTSSVNWVFRLLGTRFIIITTSKARYRAALEDIEKRFDRPWTVLGMMMTLDPQVVYFSDTSMLSAPEDVLNILDAGFNRLRRDGADWRIEVNGDMMEQINREMAVDAALREAIAKDTLEVYFQPIYSIEGKCFSGAEALLRFPHETMGMISPAEFIPLAERRGLIAQIDELVLKKVCGFIKEYDALHTLRLEHIEINISSVELMYGHMPEKLTDTIKEYGIDPRHLLFEITETAATASHDILSVCMHDLQEQGYRFVLDDYGTGYANIVQVLNLPFAAVKLDRTLLISHYEDTGSSLLLEDTIRMFSKLGITTVVEGVETEEQSELIHGLGANYIQGYHFARPMPIPEFVLFMRKNNR